MDRSANTIPPKKIVAAFVKAGGKDIAAVRDDLSKKFGAGTIAVMTDGARVLAKIWEGAWAEGHGNQIPEGQLGPIDPDVLNEHSRDPKSVESLTLTKSKTTLTDIRSFGLLR